jgi:hypothetical protein
MKDNEHARGHSLPVKHRLKSQDIKRREESERYSQPIKYRGMDRSQDRRKRERISKEHLLSINHRGQDKLV